MKQKLLLALLALFTSMGMVKAETTITLPAGGSAVTISVSGITSGKTVTLTGGTTLTSTGTSFAFNVPAGSQTYTLGSADGATYTGLVITGYVTEVVLNHATLSSVEFKENAKKLTTLTITKAALTKLTCDNCGLTTLPNLTDDVLGASSTLSFKNNNIGAVSSYPSLAKTTSILLDGNKIETASEKPTNSKVSITWGTQLLTYSGAIVANEYFGVWSSLIENKIFKGLPINDAISDISKVNVSWNKTVKTNNQGDVVFYSSNGYYDGDDVTCTISHKAKSSSYPTYKYSMTVTPAKFKLTMSAGEGGTLSAKKNGADVSNDAEVLKSEIITFAPSATAGFLFEKYDEVKGLTVSTGNSNQYQVKGDGEQPTVSIKALFKALQYKVNHTGEAHGTYTIKCDEENVANGSTLVYDKAIIIETTPEANYTARVLVNNKEFAVADNKANIVINTTNLGGSFATTANDINIKVLFESSAAYKLTIKTNANIKDLLVNKDPKTGITSNDVEVNNLKPGSTVTVSAAGDNGYTIKQVLLNAIPLSGTSSNVFEMPEGDATITFVTVKKQTVKVEAKNGATYAYTGEGQAFAYTVTPSGLTGLTFKYAVEGSSGFSTTLPVSVGIYDVKVSRSGDEIYSAYESVGLKMTITKAIPEISTLPTVSVPTGSTNYNISGGSARIGSKTVTGRFTVINDGTNDITNNVCQKAESHIATVEFEATGTDKGNFEKATVKVPVKYQNSDATKTFAIKWEGLPTDMSLTVMNGAYEIKNNATVPIGTELKFILKYPLGYSEVYLVEKKASPGNDLGTTTTASPDGLYMVKEITYTLPQKGIEVLTVSYKGQADTKLFTIDAPTVKEPKYTPDGQATLFAGSDFATIKLGTTTLTTSTTPKLADVQKEMQFSYKNEAGELVPTPINVGKYTVCVYIPAMTTTDAAITETKVEFKNKLVITPAEVTIEDAEWPTKATIGIGQTLANAAFDGGVAPVAGKFAFVDGTIKPENGKSYDIKFVPTSSNYKETISSKQATITVSDKRVLIIDKIENGAVTIKGSDGLTYNSGDALPSNVTSITVTATPATNYKLESLAVNGSAISSGASYTLGTSSVTVTASFFAIYKVTLTVPAKGLIVTKPASDEVKKGESYSFSIACLDADKPVVTVGTTTIAKGSDGKYTISNITANQTVTIKLDNPTAITVTSEATLSPGKKDMGKIAFTGLTADGKCYYGDKVTATATPVNGVKFTGWSGLTSTDNPLELVITKTTTLKALYTGSPVGIEDIEGVQVYGSTGYIFVSCDGVATLTIVGMNGQSTKLEVSGETRIETAAGIYGIVLEQGSEIMQKKIVVR